MIFFIISVIAGFLTVLTPCVLPILPVVLGSSVLPSDTSRRRPFIVIGSLIASVFVFTFILKVSTAFIGIPEYVWRYLSGIIIFIFGFSLLYPDIWSKLTSKIFTQSNNLLNQSYKKRDRWWGDIALGVALGPIFTTCSPTFFVILATVLPASLPLGIVYLLAYCFGLAVALLLIVFIGQKILVKISVISDPNSNFKKVLGWIFVILAVLIATGMIKKIETKILDAGFFDFTKIETGISEFLEEKEDVDEININQVENKDAVDKTEGVVIKKTIDKPVSNYPVFKYKEITSPSGFVNTGPFNLKDIVGKKVILLDFMTYSCINCQRTFPYLNAWYDKYKEEGLEIVAIHTPEFAFEKNIENVRKAALNFGLKFPIVLDNDYATWGAYGNKYWPHKYLIDIDGNIVYDHIGEGAYDKTEEKIVELLKERAEIMGTYVSDTRVSVPDYSVFAFSTETYFGAWRNTNFGNGTAGLDYKDIFEIPETIKKDTFYLDGEWQINREYSENIGSPVDLLFKFNAKEVYMVAEADIEKEIEVYLDSSLIADLFAGDDIKMGKGKIKDSRLYHLISLPVSGEHTLRIIFKNQNTKIYTFTFG